MAIARFLDRMCLALWASGLWLRYAMLQNLIPSFPWNARPPPWRNPRKGRDQILLSGNTGRHSTKKPRSLVGDQGAERGLGLDWNGDAWRRPKPFRCRLLSFRMPDNEAKPVATAATEREGE